MTNTELTDLVVKTLEDHKALQITTLDLTAVSDVTDFIVICSATSKRHANALSDHVIMEAKRHGIRPLGVEGETEGEWVLIDLVDVIVHIMLPEVREFYSLEKLWRVSEKSRLSANEN